MSNCPPWLASCSASLWCCDRFGRGEHRRDGYATSLHTSEQAVRTGTTADEDVELVGRSGHRHHRVRTERVELLPFIHEAVLAIRSELPVRCSRVLKPEPTYVGFRVATRRKMVCVILAEDH